MDENILARVQPLAELGNKMVSNVLSWVPPLAELGNKNGEQCSLLGATPGWSVNNVSPGYHPLLKWEIKMV